MSQRNKFENKLKWSVITCTSIFLYSAVYMQTIFADGENQGIFLHKVSSNQEVHTESTPCFIKSVHVSNRLECAYRCVNHLPECAAVYYNNVMKLCKPLRCRPQDKLENQNLVGIPSGWTLWEDTEACEEDWILFAGHCYYFIANGTIWNHAVADCNSRGAYLIELLSQDEVDWVKDSFPLPETGVQAKCRNSRSCSIWVGASLQNGSSTFVYSSGKTMVYPKWALDQPSNTGGDQDCVGLMRSGEGNDQACYLLYQYPCKKEK